MGAKLTEKTPVVGPDPLLDQPTLIVKPEEVQWVRDDGVAEQASQSRCDALLRLDKPGPGAAALGAVNFGCQSMFTLNFYLYGDQVAGTVARETPLWQAWIQERFPVSPETSQSE